MADDVAPLGDTELEAVREDREGALWSRENSPFMEETIQLGGAGSATAISSAAFDLALTSE